MTREEAKKLLPLIKAFAEGKQIQSRYIKGDKTLWYDDDSFSFDDDLEYRIKPESKYRPFNNAEECWNEMQKHQPFGWIKARDAGEYYNYSSVGPSSCFSSSYAVDFKEYVFADGTPFGVEEEEFL